MSFALFLNALLLHILLWMHFLTLEVVSILHITLQEDQGTSVLHFQSHSGQC